MNPPRPDRGWPVPDGVLIFLNILKSIYSFLSIDKRQFCSIIKHCFPFNGSWHVKLSSE